MVNLTLPENKSYYKYIIETVCLLPRGNYVDQLKKKKAHNDPPIVEA